MYVRLRFFSSETSATLLLLLIFYMYMILCFLIHSIDMWIEWGALTCDGVGITSELKFWSTVKITPCSTMARGQYTDFCYSLVHISSYESLFWSMTCNPLTCWRIICISRRMNDDDDRTIYHLRGVVRSSARFDNKFWAFKTRKFREIKHKLQKGQRC